MTTKPWIAALSVALLATTACDSEVHEEQAEEEASAQEIPEPTEVPEGCEPGGEQPEIGLVTINLQALFFNQINTGAEHIAEEAGADLQIVSGDDDSVTQANAIEDLVSSGVDAIIVDAVDTEGIKPAIRDADDAGIPVVAVDSVIDDDAVATQVGIENSEAGAEMGEFLLEQSTGEGTVHIVSALNSTVQLEREDGFTEAVEDGGMEVGTVVDSQNVQEEAESEAENLITSNPDAEYIYATGEPALIGLTSAVRGQDLTDQVMVVGWDLSEPTVDGLRDGWIGGVVQQNTFELGYQAMSAAVRHACDEDVSEDIPVPIEMVTPNNIEDYLYFLEK